MGLTQDVSNTQSGGTVPEAKSDYAVTATQKKLNMQGGIEPLPEFKGTPLVQQDKKQQEFEAAAVAPTDNVQTEPQLNGDFVSRVYGYIQEHPNMSTKLDEAAFGEKYFADFNTKADLYKRLKAQSTSFSPDFSLESFDSFQSQSTRQPVETKPEAHAQWEQDKPTYTEAQDAEFQTTWDTDPNIQEWKAQVLEDTGVEPTMDNPDYDYKTAILEGKMPKPNPEHQLKNGDDAYNWATLTEDGKHLKSPNHPTRTLAEDNAQIVAEDAGVDFNDVDTDELYDTFLPKIQALETDKIQTPQFEVTGNFDGAMTFEEAIKRQEIINVQHEDAFNKQKRIVEDLSITNPNLLLDKKFVEGLEEKYSAMGLPESVKNELEEIRKSTAGKTVLDEQIMNGVINRPAQRERAISEVGGVAFPNLGFGDDEEILAIFKANPSLDATLELLDLKEGESISSALFSKRASNLGLVKFGEVDGVATSREFSVDVKRLVYENDLEEGLKKKARDKGVDDRLVEAEFAELKEQGWAAIRANQKDLELSELRKEHKFLSEDALERTWARKTTAKVIGSLSDEDQRLVAIEKEVKDLLDPMLNESISGAEYKKLNELNAERGTLTETARFMNPLTGERIAEEEVSQSDRDRKQKIDAEAKDLTENFGENIEQIFLKRYLEFQAAEAKYKSIKKSEQDGFGNDVARKGGHLAVSGYIKSPMLERAEDNLIEKRGEHEAATQAYLLNKDISTMEKDLTYWSTTIAKPAIEAFIPNEIYKELKINDAYITSTASRELMDNTLKAFDDGVFTPAQLEKFERTFLDNTAEFGGGLIGIVPQLVGLNKAQGALGVNRLIKMVKNNKQLGKFAGLLSGLLEVTAEEAKLGVAGFHKGEGAGFVIAGKVMPKIKLTGRIGMIVEPFMNAMVQGSVGATAGLETAKIFSTTVDALVENKDWKFRMEQAGFGDLSEAGQRIMTELLVNSLYGGTHLVGKSKSSNYMSEKNLAALSLELRTKGNVQEAVLVEHRLEMLLKEQSAVRKFDETNDINTITLGKDGATVKFEQTENAPETESETKYSIDGREMDVSTFLERANASDTRAKVAEGGEVDIQVHNDQKVADLVNKLYEVEAPKAEEKKEGETKEGEAPIESEEKDTRKDAEATLSTEDRETGETTETKVEPTDGGESELRSVKRAKRDTEYIQVPFTSESRQKKIAKKILTNPREGLKERLVESNRELEKMKDRSSFGKKFYGETEYSIQDKEKEIREVEQDLEAFERIDSGEFSSLTEAVEVQKIEGVIKRGIENGLKEDGSYVDSYKEDIKQIKENPIKYWTEQQKNHEEGAERNIESEKKVIDKSNKALEAIEGGDSATAIKLIEDLLGREAKEEEAKNPKEFWERNKKWAEEDLAELEAGNSSSHQLAKKAEAEVKRLNTERTSKIDAHKIKMEGIEAEFKAKQEAEAKAKEEASDVTSFTKEEAKDIKEDIKSMTEKEFEAKYPKLHKEWKADNKGTPNLTEYVNLLIKAEVETTVKTPVVNEGDIVEVKGKTYKKVKSPVEEVGEYYQEVDADGKNVADSMPMKVEAIEAEITEGIFKVEAKPVVEAPKVEKKAEIKPVETPKEEVEFDPEMHSAAGQLMELTGSKNRKDLKEYIEFNGIDAVEAQVEKWATIQNPKASSIVKKVGLRKALEYASKDSVKPVEKKVEPKRKFEEKSDAKLKGAVTGVEVAIKSTKKIIAKYKKSGENDAFSKSKEKDLKGLEKELDELLAEQKLREKKVETPKETKQEYKGLEYDVPSKGELKDLKWKKVKEGLGDFEAELPNGNKALIIKSESNNYNVYVGKKGVVEELGENVYYTTTNNLKDAKFWSTYSNQPKAEVKAEVKLTDSESKLADAIDNKSIRAVEDGVKKGGRKGTELLPEFDIRLEEAESIKKELGLEGTQKSLAAIAKAAKKAGIKGEDVVRATRKAKEATAAEIKAETEADALRIKEEVKAELAAKKIEIEKQTAEKEEAKEREEAKKAEDAAILTANDTKGKGGRADVVKEIRRGKVDIKADKVTKAVIEDAIAKAAVKVERGEKPSEISINGKGIFETINNAKLGAKSKAALKEQHQKNIDRVEEIKAEIAKVQGELETPTKVPKKAPKAKKGKAKKATTEIKSVEEATEQEKKDLLKEEMPNFDPEGVDAETLDFFYADAVANRLKENRKAEVENEKSVDGKKKGLAPVQKSTTPIGSTGTTTNNRIAPAGRASSKVKPKAPHEMQLDLSKGFGIKIRTGKGVVASKRALGAFDANNLSLKVVKNNDLGVTAHEIGHFIDNTEGILDKWTDENSTALDAELKDFWEHGSTPPDGLTAAERLAYRRGEGIAEYIRGWIINPAEAIKRAPEFSKVFQSSLTAKTRKPLETFAQDIRDWQNATSQEQVMSSVKTFRDNPDFKFSAWIHDIIGNFGSPSDGGFSITAYDRARRMWTDKRTAINKAVKHANTIKGEKPLPMNDPTLLSRLFLGFNSKYNNIINNGMINSKGKRVLDKGKVMNMEYLFEPLDNTDGKSLEADMSETVSLMISEQTLQRIERDFKEDQAKADELYEEKVAKAVRDGKEHIGRIFRKEVKRRDEGITGIGAGLKTDSQVAQERIAEFEELEATNPERAANIREAARRYRAMAASVMQYAADKGRISQEFVDNTMKENSHYVTLQTLSQKYAGEFDVSSNDFKVQGRETLSSAFKFKKAKGSVKTKLDPYAGLMDVIHSTIKEADRNEVMTTFVDLITPTERGQKLSDIGTRVKTGGVAIFRNGVEERWEFQEDVQDAMMGIHSFSQKLPQWATAMTRLTRATITSTPMFALRNSIRDTTSRLILSRTKSKSLNLFSREGVNELELYGGDQAGYYLKDKATYYSTLNSLSKKLTGERNSVIVDAKNLGSWYKNQISKSETANRLVEFKSAFKHGKEELGLDDYNAQLYAAYQARDLMDFAVMGEMMQIINQIVPFSNAAVQGLNRGIRGAKENPAGFAARWALYSVLPTMLERSYNAFMTDDYEELMQQPSYIKDMYWNFKMNGTWLRIPKPFELGALGSGVGRVFDESYHQVTGKGNKRAFEGYGATLQHSFLPIGKEAAFGGMKPLIENMMNYDTFRQRAIVPTWENDKRLAYRDPKYASNLGKSLQRGTDALGIGMDARKIDHLTKSLFSDWGVWAMNISNLGEEGKQGFSLKTLGLFVDSPALNSPDSQWIMKTSKLEGVEGGKQMDIFKNFVEAWSTEQDPTIKEQRRKELIGFSSDLRDIWEDTMDEYGAIDPKNRDKVN